MPRLGGLVTYASGVSSIRRFIDQAPGDFPMIVDSGAWSVFRGAAEIDPTQHALDVVELQREYPEARFIGLDVIGDTEQSFDNWKLQRDLGARVEPTIHYGATVEDARRYLTRLGEGEWVNLGGMAHLQRPSELKRLVGWAATIMREAPAMRYHALGAITPYLLDRLPVSSADSSYWKLPLVIGRRLSLWNPDTRSWAGIACRKGSSLTYRSAGRHAQILRDYGVSLQDWEAISQDDTELLRLSIESQRRLGQWVADRHGGSFDLHLAAISASDLALLPGAVPVA